MIIPTSMSFKHLLPLRWKHRFISQSAVSSSLFSTFTKKDGLVSVAVDSLTRAQIEPNSTILMSVSAGSDSMAMMHIFHAIKKSNSKFANLDIRVINFNHKVRAESYDEAIFVQDWCSKYKFPFYLREFPEESSRQKASFQDRARKWRRNGSQQVLDDIVNPHGKFIVTAHHREDQLETILMKLLRGTHITNLVPVRFST